jgi:hypothetical protein
MGRGVSEAQWLAARRLSEGELPTRRRIASVLGLEPTYVYSRASKEGWATIDGRNLEIRALYREAQAVAAALSGREPPPEADGDDDAEALILAGPPPGTLDAGGMRPPAAGADANVDGDEAAAVEGSGPGAEEDAAGHGGSAGARTPAHAVPAGAAPADAAPALKVPEWDQLDPVELLANAGAFVARQIGRLIQAADRRGGRLDRAQVDGLAALARMMDRWETLAQERAVENRTKSDADLASLLERIDRRIVELAVEGAQFLDERRRRRRAAPGRGGMVDGGTPGAGAALAQPAG